MMTRLRQIGLVVARSVLLAGLYLVLCGYGNKVIHPALNEEMINKFETNFTKGIVPLDKFKNYMVSFTIEKLKGRGVKDTGFYFITESEYDDKKALDWIKHGGMSADEPELPASFRHFYDPTEPDGEHYLKDHLDYLSNFFHINFNPRVDSINWHVEHPDNMWTWEKGKAYLRNAIEMPSASDKEEALAKAYRCLGETLHMIGDMGLPAHVRDDSHPGVAYNSKPYGPIDPYEENMNNHKNEISDWAKAATDTKLKATVQSATDVKTIARAMAVFTNENFFTNQTITGTNVVPQIHPEKTYASPTLEQCKYDDMDFIYSRKVGSYQTPVKMAKDGYYVFFHYPAFPYIDEEIVQSQASVLVPNIVEAGSNVIRLFFPALKVEITEAKADGTIKGKVIHTTDKEYPTVMHYNGEVEIRNYSPVVLVGDKLGAVQCVDGTFEGTITGLAANKQIVADIAIPTIAIQSDGFVVVTTESGDCKIDTHSNLCWDIKASVEKMNWLDAVGYCAKKGAYVPSIEQLITFATAGKLNQNPYKGLEYGGLIYGSATDLRTPLRARGFEFPSWGAWDGSEEYYDHDDSYWSSTLWELNPDFAAWVLFFAADGVGTSWGEKGQASVYKHEVWCVR